jgi:hypothetical protein
MLGVSDDGGFTSLGSIAENIKSVEIWHEYHFNIYKLPTIIDHGTLHVSCTVFATHRISFRVIMTARYDVCQISIMYTFY